MSMMVGVEIYKGIEFVRISSLPDDQSARIQTSFLSKKTIKILRDGEILTDCIPFSAYVDWYNQFFVAHPTVEVPVSNPKKKTLVSRVS